MRSVNHVLQNVRIVNILILSIEVQTDESRSSGHYWKHCIGETFNDRVKDTAFYEPLLRIHEEFVHH